MAKNRTAYFMSFPLERMIHKIRCTEKKGVTEQMPDYRKRERAATRACHSSVGLRISGNVTMHSLFLCAQRVIGLRHRA